MGKRTCSLVKGGSAITSPVFVHFGWAGLCVVGAVLPVLALGYFCAARAR